MKVSLNWLQNYVNVARISDEDIVKSITSAGLEVDGIEHTYPIEGICIAYVSDVSKHPDADKLNVCKVFDGKEELQIVCGAPNVAKDQYVILAKIGATLPGGLKIKAAKIRGVESFGMLCSESELGISDSHNGIIVLPKGQYILGEDASFILGLGDTILDISITPNRGDCLSIYGIARDMGAIFDQPLSFMAFAVDESGVNTSNLASVKVEALDDCPYYSARIVQGVQVAPSPMWLQNRIKSAGMRPVNNVVDITNYIMLEYGQPMHAFDLKVIDKGIIVRKAADGETITTLDGKERKLDSSIAVIADHSKVLGVAGVMGGIHSGINPDTVDIFLECAYFTPSSVGVTSRKLGINSDSSYRYARGVDYGNTRTLLDYAADLICQICGGITLTGALTDGARPPAVRSVATSARQISNIIGVEFTNDDICNILGRLGIMTTCNDDEITVLVPSHRSDLVHAAGIAEEVARIYGVDNIPVTLPKLSSDGTPLKYELSLCKDMRHNLASLGFNEVINYSFMSEEYLSLFDKGHVQLINPISKEMEALRSLVFPGVLKSLETNWNQGYKSIKLFEFSTVFKEAEVKPNESSHLAIGIMGDYTPMSWSVKKNDTDTFYYLKGICDSLFDMAGVTVQYKQCEDIAYLHPGKAATIACEGETIGFIGALHPEIEEKLDLKAPVYIAELDFDLLAKHAVKGISYSKFGRYPQVYKDISVTVPTSVISAAMIADIYEGGKLVKDVILYDRYAGAGITDGQISLTFRILFSDDDATLTDEVVNPMLMKIAKSLEDKFGAKLR
ncbi:MAG: phenylalanine--tRNA ligase subunit beta [Deferribacteraceae bacterium]|jgi:phenylalanyl-tRNA synthetase beta chain|nr:phenylalanine--tRNA ligase subunit beta [Deferribacteraceae bacterium]